MFREMLREIKSKKWKRENLKTPEEIKRGYTIHKKETKKYKGIEYNLIYLESESGRKWVDLESKFKFPKGLLYDLRENFDFTHDFLWYDSGGYSNLSIEDQWLEMDRIAKQEIDELYKLYENIEKLLKEKISDLTTIKTNLVNFIKGLGCE